MKVAALQNSKLSASGDELLTTVQLSEEFALSRRSLEGWRITGSGPPYIRCGGRIVRYRRGDVIEWLASRRFTSTSNELAA